MLPSKSSPPSTPPPSNHPPRPPPLAIDANSPQAITEEWSPGEVAIYENLKVLPDNEVESLVSKSLRIASHLPRKTARAVARRIIKEQEEIESGKGDDQTG